MDPRAVPVAAGDARQSIRRTRTDPIMRSLAERLERLREFRARLVSPRVTAFVLVLIAERLPIEETARALAQLEEAGVRVGALIVNRVLPAASPDPFLVARQAQERVYLDEIDRRFASMPRLRVPQLARDVHGLDTLQTIAGALFGAASRLRERTRMIARPTADEFAPFYAGYIDKVPATGPVAALEAQRHDIEALEGLPENTATYRYAEGKWSVKEVLGHLADAERVFGYRLLRVARADSTPLAGFDENAWAAIAPLHARPVAEVAAELLAVRGATLALVRSLDEAALLRPAVANGKSVSGRALCWILAGHSQHHLHILRERYGIAHA